MTIFIILVNTYMVVALLLVIIIIITLTMVGVVVLYLLAEWRGGIVRDSGFKPVLVDTQEGSIAT